MTWNPIFCIFLLVIAQVAARSGADIQPKVALVTADTELTVTCNARHALAECEFNVDRNTYVMHPGSSPREYRGVTIAYHYGTLRDGECGVTFTFSARATDDTYTVSCRTRGPREQWSYGYMMLYNDPAKMASDFRITPTAPDLTMNTTVYKVGDTLIAHCRTMLCHPPVKITWYLDQNEITDAVEVAEEKWKEANQPDVRHQMIVRKLDARDNGRDVICRVHHDDISHDLQTAIKIFVEDTEDSPENEEVDGNDVTDQSLEELTTTTETSRKRWWRAV